MTVAEADAKAAKKAAKAAAAEDVVDGQGSAGQTLDVQELWRPSGSAVDFWKAAGIE